MERDNLIGGDGKIEPISIRESKKGERENDRESLITSSEVDCIIKSTGRTRFGELQRIITNQIGRTIGFPERKVISTSLRAAYCAAAEVKRSTDDKGSRRILLFTAYTEDYVIGNLCDTINKKYAARHGYEYVSQVLPYDDMLAEIGPDKQHCTWYKVLMMKNFLSEQMEMLIEKQIQYLMWIDADAVVINDEIKVEDIIARGKNRDLIIAENMHSCCLLNAGVMMMVMFT
jgi:hypothetical protein